MKHVLGQVYQPITLSCAGGHLPPELHSAGREKDSTQWKSPEVQAFFFNRHLYLWYDHAHSFFPLLSCSTTHNHQNVFSLLSVLTLVE